MKSAAVVIPTYNRWPTVKSAIDSVLSQTYEHCLCVVVDDASTDKTVEMLSHEYSDRIKLISMDRNSGQSACKNIGSETAGTDYVCFLDSDDILYPEAVASRISLLEGFESNGARASFGIFKTASGRWKELWGKKKRGDSLQIPEYIRFRHWCNNNGFLVERSLFLDSGGYNAGLRNKEDVELILRLMSLTDFRFSGSEIGEVRNVCTGTRQRERHDIIIAQGTMFSDAIRCNGTLMSKLSPDDLLHLRSEECEGLLRALYRDGRYSEFRSLYIQARKENLIRNRATFLRRYIASYFLDIGLFGFRRGS